MAKISEATDSTEDRHLGSGLHLRGAEVNAADRHLVASPSSSVAQPNGDVGKGDGIATSCPQICLAGNTHCHSAQSEVSTGRKPVFFNGRERSIPTGICAMKLNGTLPITRKVGHQSSAIHTHVS